MQETIEHAVALAGMAGVVISAWWGGQGTPEPPENMDGLAVED